MFFSNYYLLYVFMFFFKASFINLSLWGEHGNIIVHVMFCTHDE